MTAETVTQPCPSAMYVSCPATATTPTTSLDPDSLIIRLTALQRIAFKTRKCSWFRRMRPDWNTAKWGKAFGELGLVQKESRSTIELDRKQDP